MPLKKLSQQTTPKPGAGTCVYEGDGELGSQLIAVLHLGDVSLDAIMFADSEHRVQVSVVDSDAKTENTPLVPQLVSILSSVHIDFSCEKFAEFLSSRLYATTCTSVGVGSAQLRGAALMS